MLRLAEKKRKNRGELSIVLDSVHGQTSLYVAANSMRVRLTVRRTFTTQHTKRSANIPVTALDTTGEHAGLS